MAVTLAAGRYVASPPTLNDGAEQGLRLTTAGLLETSAAIGSIAAGDNNIGNVDIVTAPAIAAGTNYIGQFAGPLQLINVSPVLDTSIYAAGDTLFDRTVVTGATRAADALTILDSIVVLDEDDQAAAAMTLYFLDADVAFGTLNAAPSITDANARNILGYVTLASGDFLDVTAAKVATARNLGLLVRPATGTANIYVAATTAGTPTQTASGIKLRLGFRSL